VRDVELKNGPYNGAYVAPSASNVVFDNCLFENNGSATGGNTHGAGIYLYLSENVSFVNCTFLNNWEHGAYLDRGVGVNVTNCLFDGNGITSGLQVGQGLSYRSNYGTIMGCIMRGNSQEGLRISASAAPNIDGVTASNNIIYDNQSNDREVFIALASNVVFTDNYIGKPDGANTPPRGLLIGTDPTNIKVSNNLIIGYEFSILVGATSIANLDISNNFILGLSGADIYGIFFNTATTGDYVSIRNNYINGFTWSMGISSASFAVNNVYVADNYCVGFSSGQFTYPGGGTLGTPVYIERYKTTISASITGATVSAGATSTATVTAAGYLGPTQINGSPPSALSDGLLWSVAPASAPNTATVKVTNVTGGSLSYSTGNWQFDVRSVIFD
jgi:parallel beta-helix repeat protein